MSANCGRYSSDRIANKAPRTLVTHASGLLRRLHQTKTGSVRTPFLEWNMAIATPSFESRTGRPGFDHKRTSIHGDSVRMRCRMRCRMRVLCIIVIFFILILGRRIHRVVMMMSVIFHSLTGMHMPVAVLNFYREDRSSSIHQNDGCR